MEPAAFTRAVSIPEIPDNWGLREQQSSSMQATILEKPPEKILVGDAQSSFRKILL